MDFKKSITNNTEERVKSMQDGTENYIKQGGRPEPSSALLGLRVD